MKIRSGFVSNSSSASFVLVGYVFDADEDTIQKMWDDQFKDKLDMVSSDVFGVKDKVIVGKFLVDIHSSDGDGYIENSIDDINDFVKKVEKIKEKYPSNEAIKIYSGTREA